MIPKPGTCVWGCDSGQPFNREHIIGWQIAKAIGMRFPIDSSWGDMEVATGLQVPRGERVEPDHTIRLDDRICTRCNGGWMKRLDDHTTNCLRPALEREEGVELNPKKRLRVARWATKVGLLLAIWMHDQEQSDPEIEHRGETYAPADNFTRLYAHSNGVPERTSIWFGAIDRSVAVSEFFVDSSPFYVSAGQTVGYYTRFQLKRLLFYVTGFALDYDGPFAEPEPGSLLHDPLALTRVWPRPPKRRCLLGRHPCVLARVISRRL